MAFNLDRVKRRVAAGYQVIISKNQYDQTLNNQTPPHDWTVDISRGGVVSIRLAQYSEEDCIERLRKSKEAKRKARYYK